jgi:hypothetical protein
MRFCDFALDRVGWSAGDLAGRRQRTRDVQAGGYAGVRRRRGGVKIGTRPRPQGHPRRQPLQGGASAVVLQCQKLTIRLGLTMRLGAPSDVLARLLSYLVAVTTILGIPIGLYGYYASQQANRVNRTFDFYKDFRGDGLQKDFSLLVTRWNEKSAQADGFLKSDDFTGLSQLAASLLQTDETQTALSRLILFFDEAYSCVDKSLCDNNAAFALLQNPADQIFSMYGSYLETVRQQHPNYADGIVKVRAMTKSWSLL